MPDLLSLSGLLLIVEALVVGNSKTSVSGFGSFAVAAFAIAHPEPGSVDAVREQQRLRQLVKEQEQNKLWQDKLKTSEGVELAADNLYGFLLEGLYLTSELCFLSNYDPSSMMYVAYLRDSFQAYNRLLYRLGESPEFAAWAETHDRMNFLASIFVILGDKPVIAPSQLDALRPVIEKARKFIVH